VTTGKAGGLKEIILLVKIALKMQHLRLLQKMLLIFILC